MKAIRYYVSVILLLFLACSNGGERIDRARILAEEGKEFLSSGEFENARTKFQEVLNLDAENCDGIYGMLLSNLMIFLDRVTGSLGSVSGLVPQATEIDTIAGGLLEAVLNDFEEIESWVSLVEAKNCSFNLEKLPVRFADLELRGEWDIHEADLIGVVLDAGEGLIEFLLGYDLSLNTAELMKVISDGSLKLDMEDIVGTLRGLGFIFESSSTFLTWHPEPERREYFDSSAGDFSSLFRRLKGFLDIFSEQDESPQDDIIAWVDGDGDGTLSSEDDLIINAYSIETGELILDLSQYTSLILPILGSMLNDLRSKLTRAEDAFAFRLPQGERISFNDLLLGFGSLLGIPNNLEFDILAFYKGPDYSGTNLKPLRDILPYWYDHDSNSETPPVLLIEGEIFSQPQPGTEAYLFQGDHEHFMLGFDWNPEDASTDTTGRIKKDCVLPSEKGIEIGTDSNGAPIYLPLLYLGFKDPTFNGAIYVDSGGSCGDASGFKKADVYSLNKALNNFINVISGLLGSDSLGLPF